MVSHGVDIKSLKHIETRSVQGADDKYQPQIKSLDFAPNDRMMICSDEFLEAFDIDEIENIGTIPELTFNKLKKRCKLCFDNSCLIVIQIL